MCLFADTFDRELEPIEEEDREPTAEEIAELEAEIEDYDFDFAEYVYADDFEEQHADPQYAFDGGSDLPSC